MCCLLTFHCIISLALPALTLALGLIEDDLAHTHRLWGDLDVFIWANVLQRIL